MKIIENLLNSYQGGKMGLSGLTDELFVLYVNKIFNKQQNNILIITSTLFEANKIFQYLSKYNNRTVIFPMDDFLTSEAIAISPDLKSNRLEVINRVVNEEKPFIVITHLMGFIRYLPSKDLWVKKIIELKIGKKIEKQKLLNDLYNIGYNLESLVSKTGEIASRGFVLDVFPINEKNPIRIEFWGDEIESIRYFNSEDQLSLSNIEKAKIYPFDEFILDKNNDNIERKQKNLPLYSNKVSSIGEYLKNPIVFYIDYNQIKNSYISLKEEVFNYNLSNNNCLINYMHDLNKLKFDNEIYVMKTDDTLPIDYNNLKIDSYNTKEVLIYNEDIKTFNINIKKYLKKFKTIIICVSDDLKIKKIINYLTCPFILTNEDNILDKKVNIIKKDINNGYVIDEFIVFGENNLFKNKNFAISYKNNFKYSKKINNLNNLETGDYIVHTIHGIGIYNGIKTITKLGIKKDYLLIKYKGQDKLYIPVEKIDLIGKFTSNEGVVPKINKLGGTEWKKTKQRVKNKIKNIASQLIYISAKRDLKKGYSFSKDTEEQLLFEKDFNYEETKDQIIVTKQIKKDMEKEKPMDRLLCGDVGYGKTEVAFRAVFKAIMDSKQVAYLCPTTVLSNQQYNNALFRFNNYPINIALLNRFVSSKKTSEIKKGLIEGTIDFVIGTHRLLSKDIKFKDLGLIIVDEEQRFGVVHKERIKEYKTNVDILTLSATPIPRTLQMSLIGIRDLSIIDTPPKNRYPVQTYVLEYNDYIIKDAIYKEMSRNGQVFILYNKIASINKELNKIKQLVPEARVIYAHGQMSKKQIEETMKNFINYEYDILICTTIIEIGIDISNVNTLIINDADRFGLSQLYQIRGRVGRSNKIAFAYLIYKKDKVLSEIAIKRLNAIKEFTELGSGFSIAMRDLAIRGAGDILGSEQAGFIDTVGLDLYTKMLNEEINKIKGEIVEEKIIEYEKPLLEVETHIDDNYVNDDDIKIEIHRKINEIDSFDKLEKIKQEIEDRFGKFSESIYIYMYEEWFEKKARKIGIENVYQTKEKIELIFSKEVSNNIKIDNLLKNFSQLQNKINVNYKDGNLKIILNILNLKKHWIYYIVDLIQILNET